MPERIVTGQRWTDLPVPELGTWEPRDRVTVVLPARDNQPELDRTLAALSRQTYPDHLMDVVVVDDASQTPLAVPELAPDRTRVVRRDEQSSHGSGAARHAGALASSGEILLFLDSDMLADTHHVEAHARWHHLTDLALVLGHKFFVDVSDITAQDVHEAAGADAGLAGLFEGRPWRRHDWQEEHITAREGLTVDDDDAFLTVVGATVSVRRELYERAGGFASFGLRGIVDTEFGYRAYTCGALIVPDPAAESWHQGSRNFSTRGGEIKRARVGLAANHLPLPMFRPQGAGRQWAVPQVRVLVDATPGSGGECSAVEAERVLLTVDSVLGSTVTDLSVTVVDGGEPMPVWWQDYVAYDARVTEVQDLPPSGVPSPVTVFVPPGVLLAPETLGRSLDLLSPQVRVIQTLPDAYGTPAVQVWRTRTLERLRHAGLRDPFDLDGAPELEEVAGRRWCVPSALGIRRARPRTTQQGMVASW